MPSNYQQINWREEPPEVTAHPLWAFHEALAQNESQAPHFEQKKYWALASIKSLIEIDINREFVIEAGLAYERDVDRGVYVEDPDTGMLQRKPRQSEFDTFREATGNAVFGDNNKGDTLRTSLMKTSPHGDMDRVSFHPSISYPTFNIKNDEQERRASKVKQMDYFYDGLLSIWQRINALPDPASKKQCLDVFCNRIKIGDLGCVNERLGDAIGTITDELIQYEQKKLTKKQLNLAVGDILEALCDPKGDAKPLFDELVKKYTGFTIEGENWVVGEATRDQFAQKIIELGIEQFVLEEGENAACLSKLNVSPTPQPASQSTAEMRQRLHMFQSEEGKEDEANEQEETPGKTFGA